LGGARTQSKKEKRKNKKKENGEPLLREEEVPKE
jgi:hypothetical protein